MPNTVILGIKVLPIDGEGKPGAEELDFAFNSRYSDTEILRNVFFRNALRFKGSTLKIAKRKESEGLQI